MTDATPINALDIAELLRVSDDALNRAKSIWTLLRTEFPFFKNLSRDHSVKAQPSQGEVS